MINVYGGELSEREKDAYIKYGQEKYKGRQISQLDITLDGEDVDLKFYFKDTDFQRAYRSADYLVNDMKKLNDAKRAEFAQKERHKV